ncbi:uncharacterized protein [Panulirus ornatus]|uniref:uncharacterized protein isoform X7 n=2 Tax=Panulirus ornatus TaxID=150431 RepID=UPI003A86B738
MPLLQKVWVSGLLEMFMVWSGPVIFPELTVSGTTSIDQTVNIRNPLEGSSANQSLEEYVVAVSELQTEVQLLKDALPTVFYHSGQQAITGFINAASLAVDNAHFDELTLHKVNGHSLDSITREFLLDGVDQNVQESWRANYMEVDVFTTRGSPIAGTISGVLTSVLVGGVTVCDLVVVTRDDIIADNLVYTAPISIFGDVLVSGLVDGQDVDHLFSTRVTLDGIQTLSASYIFEAIRVEGRIKFRKSVSVGSAEGVVMEEGGTVNGIDPSNLHVTLAEVEEIIIAEEINFTSPLHISGNVTAVNINNLVLEGLGGRYWRRSAYQDITIPVQLQSAVFEGPVVGETLNGYPLSEYLHKTGQASVFGNNIFEGQVFVQGDLIMGEGFLDDNVDVSSLQENIVTLGGYQNITGLIVWSGPVIFPELRGSGTTTIDQTVNIRNPLEGSSANQSLEEYVAAVSELQTEVQLLKDALPTVLYHSGQQAITGFINAASLTVDNAHFDELTLHKVNGHSLDSITREFLLDAVDQNVQESWRANYMEVDVFTTRGSPIAGTISGVLTSGMEWASHLPRTKREWNNYH